MLSIAGRRIPLCLDCACNVAVLMRHKCPWAYFSIGDEPHAWSSTTDELLDTLAAYLAGREVSFKAFNPDYYGVPDMPATGTWQPPLEPPDWALGLEERP